MLCQRPSDGSLSHKEDLAKVIELQEIIERQLREQRQMEERLAALSAHMKHLDPVWALPPNPFSFTS